MNHKIITSYVTEEGVVNAATDSISADGALSFDGVMPADVGGTVYTEIDLAFPYTKMKGFMIYAAGAMSLLTNTEPAGADTIVLAAGEQITWSVNGPFVNPFAHDVTKIFAHLVSTTVPAELKIRILLDTTP
jgi:hypothetical protein